MPKKTATQLLAMVADFDWEAGQKELAPDFTAWHTDLLTGTAKETARKYGDAGVTFDAKDPHTTQFMKEYVGERITQLSDTSKEDVSEAIVRAVRDADPGLSTSDFRDLVLDTVREKYEGYESWRALRIARTETSIAYNHGTIFGGQTAGFENFEVIDGDDDEECAAADGDIWTAAQCLDNPVQHPNCVRNFVPSNKKATEPDDEDDASPSDDVADEGDD